MPRIKHQVVHGRKLWVRREARYKPPSMVVSEWKGSFYQGLGRYWRVKTGWRVETWPDSMPWSVDSEENAIELIVRKAEERDSASA